ncbi:MAG: type II toxin-antitoxin system RelE/ParE family toxin [Bacteroidales bacterium]|nr:type II toxin-antitoxin system RelE/ParE family toxin [Bacteroidales bacterium]
MKQIIAFRDYYKEFYDSLSQDEKDKVDRTMVLMQSDSRMPAHYIKPLEEGINELRITTPNKELRILFIYDGSRLVVLLNCLIKKTQKTPRAVIEKAIKLKKQYYEEKQTW